MPGSSGPGNDAGRVRLDLLRAGLEAGFALVRMAETACASADGHHARKALREASKIFVTTADVVAGLDRQQAQTLEPPLSELVVAIALADRTIRASGLSVRRVWR